jgi:tetratricopeptide (TPR) repeat protein
MKEKTTLAAIYLTILIALLLGSGCGGEGNLSPKEKALKAGRAAIEYKNYSEAINIFKSALKDKPSDRDLLYYTGYSFARLDLIDSALIYMRKAKVLNPRDRDINKQLVILCPLRGDYECALNAVATLVATGDNERMYWRTLAELYYRTENKPLAIKYYKLLIADNPDMANEYLSLSRTLAELGKFDESNEVLAKSTKRFGPTLENMANLAVNYVNMKMLDSAEVYFRKAVAIDPDNVPVWVNLANVLERQGSRPKKVEALELYKKYYSRTPKIYNLDSLIPALEAELQN